MSIRFGEFTFDSEARQLRRGTEALPLTPKLHDLLALLIEMRPRVVSRRELMDRLWPDVIVEEANIRNLVAELRHLLGDDDRTPRYIRTVHRVGYAFIAEVAAASSEVAAASATGRRPLASLLQGDRVMVILSGRSIIGRSADCDLFVNHASVSRHHAAIDASEGRATIEDLGSKNGTQINGRKLTAIAVLSDGDAITVGEVVLHFAKGTAASTASIAPNAGGTTAGAE